MQGTNQDFLIIFLINLDNYRKPRQKGIAKCKIIQGESFKMKDGGELGGMVR